MNNIGKLYGEGEKVIISQHSDGMHLNLANKGLDGKISDVKKAICTILTEGEVVELMQDLGLEEVERKVSNILEEVEKEVVGILEAA